jgi:hypothetical protein
LLWRGEAEDDAGESQVGNVCERFFAPTPRFASYKELNAWLADRCVAHAKATAPPRFRGLSGMPLITLSRRRQSKPPDNAIESLES